MRMDRAMRRSRVALVVLCLWGAGCGGADGTGGSGQALAGGGTAPTAAPGPGREDWSREMVDPAAGSDAGSAGSDHAGSSAGMTAGLEGLARKPIAPEEFQAAMQRNQDAMKALKLALDGRNQAAAFQALDQLAKDAEHAMASEPEKNGSRKAAYLALFGSLKAASQGLRGVVKMEAWNAVQPGFNVIGSTCASCHQQFRLSPEERAQKKARSTTAP